MLSNAKQCKAMLMPIKANAKITKTTVLKLICLGRVARENGNNSPEKKRFLEMPWASPGI